MTELTIDRQREGDICFMALKGEARLEAVHRFDEAALRALGSGATHVLIDMSKLTFMDSASAGVLLRLDHDLSNRGGKLVLFALGRVVMRMFEGAGLTDRFNVADDEAAARAALA